MPRASSAKPARSHQPADDDSSAADSMVPSFAELLEHLFRTRLSPEGRPFTNREAALGTQGQVGYNHVKKLRSGAIKNPTRTTIIALCLFFKVHESYFFPQLRDEQLKPVEYPGRAKPRQRFLQR